MKTLLLPMTIAVAACSSGGSPRLDGSVPADLAMGSCTSKGGTCVAVGGGCNGRIDTTLACGGDACCVPYPACTFTCDGGVVCACTETPGSICLPSEGTCTCVEDPDGGGASWSCGAPGP